MVLSGVLSGVQQHLRSQPQQALACLGCQVQWRLLVGALALAVLSLRGPVLSFRQRFFRADDIIG